MRPLPVAAPGRHRVRRGHHHHPGTPDRRSAGRYLWWLVRLHWVPVVYGMVLGITWMLAGALIPAVVGRAIDDGIARGDVAGLARWAGVFALLTVVQAVSGILRHRNAIYTWLSAAFRTVQVTVEHAGRLGATLPKRLAAGEVAAIGASDTDHIGRALDISARLAGAVVTLITIAVILLSASVKLGLLVLLGVPAMMAITSVLIKPLQTRDRVYRERQGALSGRALDIVSGLRVLRGIGGEAAFATRYRHDSQKLRAAGVRVATIESLLDASEVLIPGLFLALITWLGARYALAGEISPGEFVSFYGYVTFLAVPLRTFGEALDKVTRGRVAAERVLRLLQLTPEITDPPQPEALPAEDVPLMDVRTGLTIRPGALTVLVADRSQDAAEIADRLGRYTDGEVTLGGVPLRRAALRQVRERILVSDDGMLLFSGPLRCELDVHDSATDQEITSALHAADATDIVDALPEGLDTFIAERGREFSGGQLQRLRLARALLADRPILILVEPTSAVDTHTEARIADRVATHRTGRTTLITSSSPLMLARADHVVYMEDGKVSAEGTHPELLAREPRYRAFMSREG